MDQLLVWTNAWRLFIKELVKELVIPYMKRYMEGTGPTVKSILQRQLEDVGWKTKHSHHRATGIHQTEWSIEEEEVQDLPSCQRQISQRQTSQQLVFSVWPVCKEHKPVVVICESTEMAIWYSTVPVWFNFVCSICIYSVTFTTIHYSCTTHSSISVLSVISDMRHLCVSKWKINIFNVLNVLVWKTAKIII